MKSSTETSLVTFSNKLFSCREMRIALYDMDLITWKNFRVIRYYHKRTQRSHLCKYF